MMQPFLPFTRPSIDDATIARVVNVLRSGWITSGQEVQEFEQALSQFFGGRHVRVFNSGSATLEVALRIAGVQAGDEVITTPLSWVATSNVILEVGAKPVFIDVDPVTRNFNLELIEKAITPKTRVILPVYLAGLPVNMDRLYSIAKHYNLRVVEDAAQAMGSTWRGHRIGSIGDLVSFSFHANKNLTSIEGGALVLNTKDEVHLAEKYRLQGLTRTGFDTMDVDVLGGKYNLTAVAASVGLGQIAHLENFNRRRHALAQLYFDGFEKKEAVKIGVELPIANFTNTNWHMFQIVLPENRLSLDRAGFMAKLKEFGIGSGVHYPVIHLFTLYRKLGFKNGQFPHAERIGRNTVTLPLFPSMEDQDVSRVCEAVNTICAQFTK
ncbi:DegT/DnrJ/EryC1/StrS family aminotransferase [Candidatus Pandoraea novymonadis]|uniref:UDP-4-amino-4-deoxy-L-arabinose--oxoglutarate aminotransferase n=1 Tax=Candidatus Pandoraea novymonadis TaxID=1808959 RepID=A0ABX5FFY6_9BURK|nr:DegT/DnrJ/EryC1/StrS aminotransferase family protein [Candidatus Pandoraea novymonadis]PSB92062.1 UDP-4-amino-4-deoxy-L-arabinose--oxoglutarate aminotransferase [Candidatus Pandoraea novymonadis]